MRAPRSPSGSSDAAIGAISSLESPTTCPLDMPLRIALYQPDIPQNTGTVLRLCACLGIEAHIIEPAGFPTSDRAFRRAGMDYLDAVTIVRHAVVARIRGVAAQRDTVASPCSPPRRACPISITASRPTTFSCSAANSAGVPDEVHDAADARLVIPLKPGLRSLNVAITAAMAAGEALRQIGGMSLDI